MNKYDVVNEHIADLVAQITDYYGYTNACKLVLQYVADYSMGKISYHVPVKESKMVLVSKLRRTETYGWKLSNLQIAEIIRILDDAEI